MKEYLIRFNTKNNGDASKVWRVFEGNTQYLVANVHITSPVWTQTSFENEVQKWNIATSGYLKIRDNEAYIDSFDLDNFNFDDLEEIKPVDNIDWVDIKPATFDTKQYMNAEELMEAGYISHPSSALHVMVEKPSKKIYESPDKGKTVYERDFGADPSTRTIVKTSVQQQWTIKLNSESVDL